MRTIDVPASWRLAALSEVCSSDAPIMYGILQPGPQVDDGVPYVRPTEIEEGGIRLASIRTTSRKIAQRYARSALRPGDLLITIVGTLGKIAEVPVELDGANITQSSARIRVNSKVACSRYVRHFLSNSDLAKRQFEWHRLGTGVPRLNLHHVRDLQIPLPPLSEQKRIAAILDKADAIRRKRAAVVEEMGRSAEGAFINLFGHPAGEPRWPLKTIAEVGKVTTGNTPSTSKAEYFGGNVPWVRPAELGDWYPVSTTEKTLSEAGLAVARSVRPGATLVCCIGATLGKVGTVSRRSAINQQINAVEFDDCVADWYGMFCMRLLSTRLVALATHTTLPILNKRDFSRLQIPVPPLDQQHAFSEFICSLLEARKNAVSAERQSCDLFTSLVQRAFRGEL